MIKKTLFILSFFCVAKLAFNQEKGHIYISNFPVDENYASAKVNAFAFDDASAVFIASKNGIAYFDGISWLKIKGVPHHIFSLKYDSLNAVLYAGGKDEIGYVKKDELGQYYFQSIKKAEKKTSDFTQIYIAQNTVCFYGDGAVYILDRNTQKINSTFLATEKGTFAGIINHKDRYFVNVEGKGVHKIENDKLTPISNGKKFKDSQVLFSIYYNLNKTILGTSDNKIYLFNGNKFEQFASHTEIRGFLDENILWDACNVSDQHFAISTLTGGCAIIGKNYGKIIYTINFQTGLADDEIFALGLDLNKGLWLAHEQGMSRCELNLPVRTYTSYPGLFGSINDVLKSKNNLFIGTNEGVFKLSEVKSFKEIEKLIKEKVKEPIYVKTQEKSRLFKKNKTVLRKKYKTSWVTRTKKEYALQSIRNKYLKLGYIEEKCKKIIEVDKHILALTNFGLYELNDTTVSPVISNSYINDVCKDKDTSIFYVGTLQGIQVLHLNSDNEAQQKWEYLDFLNEIDFPVYSIVQSSEGNLILGSEEQAFFCKQIAPGNFAEPEMLEFPEDIYEPINAVAVNKEIFFIQSAGIFAFNASKKSINYTSLEDITADNVRFIINKNQVWLHQQSNWKYFNKSFQKENMNFLQIFDKCKSLYLDDENHLWVIQDDQINAILLNEKYKPGKNFQVTIKRISDNRDSLYELNHPKFEYTNNTIRIKLSSPYYFSPHKTNYQFRVLGLKNHESWSAWSSSSQIELFSVPPGSYTIQFRAKNVLSQLSDIEEIKFEVLIPFWQTTEFFIIISASILLLILFTFFMINRRLAKKKRILEEKVKERTIELEEEKNKTEALLLNILPKETAQELKEKSKVTPRNYESATVLFTDFKGFTQIAEQLTPEELVNEIDYCFKEFDHIIGNYKIEKIKTIGDAYMCAGGLPTKYKENAREVVKAALEIRNFMEKYKEKRVQEKRPYFEVRIGVHTGKLVAGVVGTKKYAYDIWGDTVNVASRMESSGETGKVNISGDTYQLVKNNFKCEHRGKIEAKNKGQIDMYFVEGQN
jgi:class 3 adenylate cyclase